MKTATTTTAKNLKITTIFMHVFVKCVQLAVWWFVSLIVDPVHCRSPSNNNINIDQDDYYTSNAQEIQ